MCLLHPSSTYHFSVEVFFDFPGLYGSKGSAISGMEAKSLIL
jgi:hypothetical protein